MTYEEFKDHVVDVIKDYLPDEYMDADVTINQVAKNNETLDGLVIKKPGQNVSPTLYLNSFYENYCEGRDMEDILEKIADLRTSHDAPDILNDLSLSVEDITDYEKIKDSLVAHVVGIEGNLELLEKRPHVVKEDMAIMYKISLNDEMSIPITNELFKGYNIPLDEFHDKAMENISEKVTVISMSQTIAEMMGGEIMEIPPEKDMIVLSNESKVNGAIGIFDKATMDSLAEKYGDFILLPSSVHESLVVPEAAGLSVEDARQMVREVNATQVEPQDKLTDNVYKYDKSTHELRICREEPEVIQSIEQDKAEIYKDDHISITEDKDCITITNTSDKDIAVYAETLADTLGLCEDDAVVVLYKDEDLSWENIDYGFTGEIVGALKKDIEDKNIRSAPLDENLKRELKREEQAVALA